MKYLFKAAGIELDDVSVAGLLPGVGHMEDHDCSSQANQILLLLQSHIAALSS